VAIDIKLGRDQNTVNLRSEEGIPVAILGTADFDPTMAVNPDTLTLLGAHVKVAGGNGKFLCHSDDVNHDAVLDLVCMFDSPLKPVPGESVAVLSGKTFDGIPIQGQDPIRIVLTK
jgi:hypothetical protein